MEIRVYDNDGTFPVPVSLYKKLADLESAIQLTRWERLLIWFGLRKDTRFVTKLFRYP